MTRVIAEEDKVLLQSIVRTGLRFYLLVAALLTVIVWGFSAYYRQLTEGLWVTGMNRPVLWGLYITNFVFFIGISHAGTLISAILRVTQAEWRRPITRIAEAITLFALLIGASQVIIDLGRPDRMIKLITHGRFQSPLLWDVSSVTIYLLGSLTYLYLPLIPDVAILRDHLGTQVPAWRRRLYQILSLGWQGNAEQWRRLEKGISIMAVLIIPVAVMVHTVVSWIFGMTLRPMWHSTILGPYFVVGAIFSGVATLFIVMTIMRRILHLEAYITIKQYNNLGLVLLIMSLSWFYFTGAEYLTTFYGDLPDEMTVLLSKLVGEFSWPFWAMILCNFVVPVSILIWKRGRGIVGTFIAAVAIDIGMWLERFTIVVPTLTRPRLTFYGVGIYRPTLTEWGLFATSGAVFVLLLMLFFKLFPAVSIWEVEEGREIEAAKQAVARIIAASPEAPAR
ncbi:MAG: polysulfide reductase [Anaerolineales bacterium]|nr:MAG: polysulfide reductase [Anaerolineales bacterium]